MNIIIVHGAGGHIHHLAHSYQLSSGTCGNKKKEAEARHTQEAVTKLHEEIIALGKEAGLPLYSIPTHTVLTQKDTDIEAFNLAHIHTAISNKQIPVLSGDIVTDSALGMSVCSGDTLVSHLTTLFPIAHILFASDVDGVYTKDPHTNPDAQLLPELTLSELEHKTCLSTSHNKDVTGGLQGKMQSCMNLFTTSNTLKEIHIFNGLQSNNLKKVLQEVPFPHTCITS